MASCIAYRVDGSDARLLFDVQRASFNSASLIGALSNLSMELDEPITLVWDNLRAHHSEDKGTLAFINESPWLTVHRLPAYAPDLNPVEGVWSALKARTWPTSAPRTEPSSNAPHVTACNASLRIKPSSGAAYAILDWSSTDATRPTKLSSRDPIPPHPRKPKARRDALAYAKQV
jgi:transposase